ncbi:MAG: hypothetical protein ACRDS9_08485 [Pseudonocardiaceae bacterium]
MTIALNFTVPLKQDPQSQEGVKHLVDSFAQSAQPMIDDALARSQIVHFARILLIDNKYLQVITEFDGDPTDYTEFFRKELGPIFQAIFALAEGAPPWEELDNRDAFYKYTHSLNLTSLGTSTICNEGRGYLFSAMGDKTVRELQTALNGSGSIPAQPVPVHG